MILVPLFIEIAPCNLFPTRRGCRNFAAKHVGSFVPRSNQIRILSGLDQRTY
jgi:hypothetical protein